MKKLFIFLFALIPFLGNAQPVFYKTTEVAVLTNGEWGEWQETDNITVVIDFEDWVIKIQSFVSQQYVLSNDPTYIEEDTIGNFALDQDGSICLIKLRAAENQPLQIYIIYNSIGWVYNLRKI